MRLVTSVLVLCSLALASSASAQPAPQRAIVNVTGQLYRAQNNNHYTVFLVTPEGIIMSDPLNRDFARWLKGQLQVKRLPGGLDPTVGSWIDALSTINALDHEHALTGHALSGTKKDALQSLQYLLDISKGVAAGIAAGRSLAEIQKTLTLDAYKGFERWDTIRDAHIAAVYATIRGVR